MLIILIALVVGLVVAMAALFYYWRTPGARCPSTDGKPLIVVGFVFIVLSVVYAVNDGSSWYVWGLVGLLFVAVELRQIRQKRDSQRGSVGLATGHRHLPVVDKSPNVLNVVSIKDIFWAVAEPSPV